jgi:hypothetical protein
VRACVHMDEYSYVYEYLCLYCVSKKRMKWGNEKFLVQYHFFIFFIFVTRDGVLQCVFIYKCEYRYVLNVSLLDR